MQWYKIGMATEIPCTPDNLQELFEKRNGSIYTRRGQQFPAIHQAVHRTDAGTRYLTGAGCVIVNQPSVCIDGLDQFLAGFDDDLAFGDYLKDTTEISDAAQLSKTFGQLCYLSFGPNRTHNDEASKYHKNIKASGHGSVLEHPNFSFLLYGISRSLTHELVRHRAGAAFSQVSQRYVSDATLRFVRSPAYHDNEKLRQRFAAWIDLAAAEYRDRTELLLEQQLAGTAIMSGEKKRDLRKKVRQEARECLPNEAEAPIGVTFNVRADRHVLEMRCSPYAALHIRNAFLNVFLCLSMIEPYMFEDYSIVQLDDGTHAVTTPYRKV